MGGEQERDTMAAQRETVDAAGFVIFVTDLKSSVEMGTSTAVGANR